jgi:hypothetical protein
MAFQCHMSNRIRVTRLTVRSGCYSELHLKSNPPTVIQDNIAYPTDE